MTTQSILAIDPAPASVKFFVPCLPVAQPRPKARAFDGHAQIYAAKKSHPIHEFKAAVKLAWHNTGKPKLEGPLVANLLFVFQRPASVPKKRGDGRLQKPTRPDLDNLAKGVLDSLNGLAYTDDGQIVWLTIGKFHAAAGETPGVQVAISEFQEVKQAERLF